MKRVFGTLAMGLVFGLSTLGCAPETNVENTAETEQAVVVNVYKISVATNQILNYEVWNPRPVDGTTYIWRTLEEVQAANWTATPEPIGNIFDLYWYYRDADENADPPRHTAECQELPF